MRAGVSRNTISLTVTGPFNPTPKLTLIPVSYTHLDVYKRQVPQRPLDPSRPPVFPKPVQTARFRYHAGRATRTPFPQSRSAASPPPAEPAHAAHLHAEDVYKRQAQNDTSAPRKTGSQEYGKTECNYTNKNYTELMKSIHLSIHPETDLQRDSQLSGQPNPVTQQAATPRGVAVRASMAFEMCIRDRPNSSRFFSMRFTPLNSRIFLHLNPKSHLLSNLKGRRLQIYLRPFSWLILRLLAVYGN